MWPDLSSAKDAQPTRAAFLLLGLDVLDVVRLSLASDESHDPVRESLCGTKRARIRGGGSG